MNTWYRKPFRENLMEQSDYGLKDNSKMLKKMQAQKIA
jgi:hypothetical protein